MNTIDITTIIELALGIIIAIPMVIIIPKIKAWAACKLSARQIEIAKIIIKSAVSAAEQIYINSEKSGASKKKYVMEYAKNKTEFDDYHRSIKAFCRKIIVDRLGRITKIE